jgi:peroxiredoxin
MVDSKIFGIPHNIQILTFLLVMAVNSSFAQTSLWYSFDGTASLEIIYTNSVRPNICKVSSYKMFPEEYIDFTDTLSFGSGKKTFKIPASGPQSVKLSFPGTELPMLLVPGANLVCVLDFSDIRNVKFQASDSLSIINDYLVKKKFHNSAPLRNNNIQAEQSADYLTSYSAHMNDIYQKEMLFYNQNKARLPGWFQTFEYWNIRNADASSRMNTVVSREISIQKVETIPAAYYRFLDSLPVHNPSAKNSYKYYLFLYELFNKRLEEKNTTDCNANDWLSFHICQAEKELSGDILDMYKAWTIQLVYNQYKREVAKEYIKQNNNIFTDPIWLEKLQGYFKSKENFLAKNKPAPNFALTDLQDSLTTLRSLKGNIIVLSFWFAGCKPCVEEFPFENALAAKFRDQEVKIVNVCVNTTEENWRRYSERFGLRTINLWANTQWEKTVIEKYNLTIFPRYVLLDKNLNVVETDAGRPSQDLENQIMTLLNH